MEKAVVKFGDIEIEKQKFYQYKRPISMKNIDKIVVSHKVSFGKKGFKYFIGSRDAKKIVSYAYFFQKYVHIEETLMILNACLFL